MTCLHCHEAVHADAALSRDYSYGYRHDSGSLFCASSAKTAKPEVRP